MNHWLIFPSLHNTHKIKKINKIENQTDIFICDEKQTDIFICGMSILV